MAIRNERRVPKLSHEAVRDHLLDYHFGRLSPQMNEAVERHVRSCTICQNEGLVHLATEKRVAVKRTRKVRTRKARTRPLRLLTLLLTAILLFLIVELASERGYHWFWQATAGIGAFVRESPTVHAPTPTPATLAPALTWGAGSSGAVAAAVSPDGKTVATANVHDGAASVSLWDAAKGAQLRSMSYSDATAPGVLAWAPDGSELAAANGTHVIVWRVKDGTQLWALLLPHPPAIRVYDVQAIAITQQMDPATAMAKGPYLQWGQAGQLIPTTSAGSLNVAQPDGPVVGGWQAAGSHLFQGDGNVTDVGISASDVASHAALLSWSPDGRHLFWGSLAAPVASTVSGTAAGTPASASTPHATATAAGIATAPATTPPNAVAAMIAAQVAHAGKGDALLWFSGDGRWTAVCDRSTRTASLSVFSNAENRIIAYLPGNCTSMGIEALAWRPDASGFIVALPNQPVASFTVPGK